MEETPSLIFLTCLEALPNLGKRRHLCRNNERHSAKRTKFLFCMGFLLKGSKEFYRILWLGSWEAGAKAEMVSGLYNQAKKSLQARKRGELGMKIGMGIGSEGTERGRWAG